MNVVLLSAVDLTNALPPCARAFIEGLRAFRYYPVDDEILCVPARLSAASRRSLVVRDTRVVSSRMP